MDTKCHTASTHALLERYATFSKITMSQSPEPQKAARLTWNMEKTSKAIQLFRNSTLPEGKEPAARSRQDYIRPQMTWLRCSMRIIVSETAECGRSCIFN